jgi:hypothetical protein
VVLHALLNGENAIALLCGDKLPQPTKVVMHAANMEAILGFFTKPRGVNLLLSVLQGGIHFIPIY